MSYETILAESSEGIGTLTINRPGALNALNSQVLAELTSAAEAFDADPEVRVIVITGNEKAFAAGADIKEMAEKSYAEVYLADWFAGWDRLTRVRKPIIAAVAGYALGGGCELAMMADFIIAADTAKFGQPEINLGVMPGMGGSQRLTRAIGKAKAMDLCLTGRFIGAEEAERSGLVARVVPADELLAETRKAAAGIAQKSLLATIGVKEAVNAAFETTLSQGLLFERRTFHAAFGTQDQKEGMRAFSEKREAKFTDS
ncbi:enoyl-CoA hydratase [Sediminivirga luteola]|uniref:Probable enoyl-CoA hydratase echA8 n=1 Tax=Sediminivirga luteola TaxID=1774748 RepID=A0A8J2U1F3_9MICO|nr:enoyl-CoA hydratase [Sediminivirga luteola]MCI2265406.1 enoyl-CoA hydratase [Sediminivirga luteola]GGA28858.1 enoyl-CoA hydratase [Sediminivirga luteola]